MRAGQPEGGFGHIFGPHLENGLDPVTFAPIDVANPDGQTTVDAWVRAHVSEAAILSLRMRNVGGERYAPILGYPAPGRTFSLELSTR